MNFRGKDGVNKTCSDEFDCFGHKFHQTLLKYKNISERLWQNFYRKSAQTEAIFLIEQRFKQKWGEEQLKEVEEQLLAMSKEGWDDLQKKGEEINQLLTDLMPLPVDHPKVQEAIALHHQQLNGYYEVSLERYKNLGDMYVQDDRFKAHYDDYKKELASFIRDAIQVYVSGKA